MRTREIYLKVLENTDEPVALMKYWFNNFKKSEPNYTFDWIAVRLKNDGETINDSVLKMEEIEKRDGFHFWCASPEGKEFLYGNAKEIGGALIGTVLNLNYQ
jgi:hypothetical protein